MEYYQLIDNRLGMRDNRHRVDAGWASAFFMPCRGCII